MTFHKLRDNANAYRDRSPNGHDLYNQIAALAKKCLNIKEYNSKAWPDLDKKGEELGTELANKFNWRQWFNKNIKPNVKDRRWIGSPVDTLP